MNYKEKYENALKVINEEIEKIKKTKSLFMKVGKMNEIEKMIGDYHLRFLNEVKEKLK